ncbi:AraC family transcriptional regulator [Brevundimonas balnearis]|uniref:AraC family transcriptional regulator N-terminal domain-containing protein n=1 Tax=Brevundimonas balnearis TaxID=1572858 RepID=A0ABV6R6N9_9CAUL
MTQVLHDVITRLLDAEIGPDGYIDTAVPGLTLMRTTLPTPPSHMQYRPKLCVVTQGAKQVLVADQTIAYGSGQAMIVTVEMPVVSQVVEAASEHPFTGLTLDLDAEIVLDVVTRLDSVSHLQGAAGLGLTVSVVEPQLEGALLRLLELVDQPHAVSILYPAIMRELAYWLLMGPAGRNVARMVLPEGQPQRIARAIAHLRQTFDAPVSIADLASLAGMSPSSFHHHFKTLTSISPLQYQKQIRLLEARRMMVTEGVNAGVAASAVGYESPSQFSREYARMFGAPPRRETQRARSDPARFATLESGRSEASSRA